MRRNSCDRVRVLLVADTHLGFDLPFRPRIKRRRRGHDFFANFERALEPALEGKVDLVVHGGDVLYRSRVPPGLNATPDTPSVWPTSARRSTPLCTSHSRTVRSALALASTFPSGLNATPIT